MPQRLLCLRPWQVTCSGRQQQAHVSMVLPLKHNGSELSTRLLTLFLLCLQGFDVVLSDMLQFTSGINDVELSLELAGTAMNVATGHFYDEYGEAYAQRMGFRHTGYLRPGGNLVMKVYEVRAAAVLH